jgi:hypothetical protein
MKHRTAIILFFFLILYGSCKKESDLEIKEKKLPDIQQFKTDPSDRFLVNIETIDAGHAFKGRRANTPHQGAHTHWDNTSDIWPQGGTLPENYPVIYAVADGSIDRVDFKIQVGNNDRYGLDLAFARDSDSVFVFVYAIEPLVPEPSIDFYKRFICVTLGQKVKKGDTIAYMYLPPSAGIGCHIHFHMMKKNSNNFYAPAIFTRDVVDSFYQKWGQFGYDGTTPLPSCMGYMLDADENPYGDGQVNILK